MRPPSSRRGALGAFVCCNRAGDTTHGRLPALPPTPHSSRDNTWRLYNGLVQTSGAQAPAPVAHADVTVGAFSGPDGAILIATNHGKAPIAAPLRFADAVLDLVEPAALCWIASLTASTTIVGGTVESASRRSRLCRYDASACSRASICTCAIAMSIAVAIGLTSRDVCANRYPPWTAAMSPVASCSTSASCGMTPSR